VAKFAGCIDFSPAQEPLVPAVRVKASRLAAVGPILLVVRLADSRILIVRIVRDAPAVSLCRPHA
jgi:hypothetical protein